MKLEEQVCSLELAKKLKEFGVRQESLFYWSTNSGNGLNEHLYSDDQISRYSTEGLTFVSAFTVAELGEMIGCIYDKACFTQKLMEVWNCSYAEADMEGVLIIKRMERANTEANARSLMLIHLIETGIVKV